ncbi:methyl-accepting chemotaxis protein [Oceanospirillum sediminis]|uniref:Methyl-accepting chemotaxis protein n=1 Tax=Oceanospirillum sediminis TaxID=2760088 RepID=A0A839IPR2_9GAMM|nr:methyl-accepting chemotaxis protein [Oceanospirillum sediminis]
MGRSIKTRLILWIGVLMLLVLAVQLIIGLHYADQSRQLVAEQASDLITQEVRESLQQRAGMEAGKIHKILNEALQVSHGLATTAAQIKPERAWEDPVLELDRLQFIGMLRGALQSHSGFLSVYSGWESNAFDDADDDNLLNRVTGSAEDGRFVPFWSRSAKGHMEMTPMRSHTSTERFADGTRKAEFYLCPKEQKQSCLLEPQTFQVQGRDQLLSSVVTPVMHKDEFLGMTGVDLSLNFIQQQAEAISQSLYNGQAEVRIFSQKGITLGDSHRPESAGKKRTADGIPASYLAVSVPIHLQGLSNQWTLQIQVPEALVLNDLVRLQNNLADIQEESRISQLIIGPVLALITLLIAAWVIHRRLMPLNQIQSMLQEVAQGGGNLTHRLDIASHDEIGQVAGFFNQFVEQLQTLVSSVQRSGVRVQDSAQQGASLSSQMNQQLAVQQQEISQISASIEQLSQSSHLIADNMKQLTESAGQANTQVAQAQKVMLQVDIELNSMASEIALACDKSEQLAQHGQEIHQILDTIRAIAEQTNLLALNAAIEAARAGEQGRGFAVVADEVRGLAQKTQSATGEIDQVIEQLLSSIQQIATANRQSGEQTQTVVHNAEQTRQALDLAADQINRMDQRCQQVFLAVDEQQQASDHLVRSVNSVNEVASELLEGADISQQQSQDLTDLALELNRKTCRFVV